MIAGPMFAGKTEELLRRVHRAQLAGLDVQVFGHRLDTRGGAERLSTHAGRSAPARLVEQAAQLRAAIGATRPDLVAIDEAQFFGPPIVPVIEELLAAVSTLAHPTARWAARSRTRHAPLPPARAGGACPPARCLPATGSIAQPRRLIRPSPRWSRV